MNLVHIINVGSLVLALLAISNSDYSEVMAWGVVLILMNKD